MHPCSWRPAGKVIFCWVGQGKAGPHAEPAAASKGDKTGFRYPGRAPDWMCSFSARSGQYLVSGASYRCQEGSIRKKGEQALGWWHYLQEGTGASFLELLRLSSEEKAATVNFLLLKTSLLSQLEKVDVNHGIIKWLDLKDYLVQPLIGNREMTCPR